jgi:chorismate mutase
MENLETLRKEIDEIDKQLAVLIEKRLEIVTKVGAYKKENNIPIQDIKRDKAVINNALRNINDEKYNEYIKKVFNSIILISKSIQY